MSETSGKHCASVSLGKSETMNAHFMITYKQLR